MLSMSGSEEWSHLTQLQPFATPHLVILQAFFLHCMAQERLHLFALLVFTSTAQASGVNSLNYWSASRLQQGVCGQQSHFALDNIFMAYEVRRMASPPGVRAHSTYGVASYKTFSNIPEKFKSREESGHTSTSCVRFSLGIMRGHLYLSRHPW